MIFPAQQSQTVPYSYCCAFCGMIHTGGVETCPNVKSIEYYADGTIKKVEKKP